MSHISNDDDDDNSDRDYDDDCDYDYDDYDCDGHFEKNQSSKTSIHTDKYQELFAEKLQISSLW